MKHVTWIASNTRKELFGRLQEWVFLPAPGSSRNHLREESGGFCENLAQTLKTSHLFLTIKESNKIYHLNDLKRV